MAVRGTASVGLALLLLSGCIDAPVYDTVLVGGTVVDGSGAPAFVADVAIHDGRIAAVGPDLDTRGGEVVDVSGLVVSPGFWDNHAHLVTLAEHPDAENFIRQGITTVLAPLHSQPQPWPLDAYMDDVRMAPNVGMFAGHTWIRERVIGLENRPPTALELEWMRALVDSTMQQGALGLSTGLEYVPAAYAELDEIVALAEVAAGYGGIYVTHMRDEGVRVIEAVQETLEVGRQAGIPVQINHHKVTGADQWGATSRTLALLDSASAAGQDVVHDVYPYTAFSTYSDLLFPSWVLADGPDAFAVRVADPTVWSRLVSEMRTIYGQQTGPGPESVQFRTLDGHPDMTGRTLADYLVDAGRPTTLDETIEVLIELQLNGRFIGNFYGMDEADVIRIMQHPTAMFETDGDLVQPGVGFPHPRTYGSFPRILGRYVRELGVLTMEEAVRKMTSAPAEWLGQADRGRLAVGMVADITVFDADRITDRAQFTDPHHYSEGVVHVWVGGTAVLREEEMTGARPGRFLERGRRF